MLSKEFINHNKQELSSFIKTQNRKKQEDTYNGLSTNQEKGLMYNTHDRADGSKHQKTEDELDKSAFVFNDQDVRPEKSF